LGGQPVRFGSPKGRIPRDRLVGSQVCHFGAGRGRPVSRRPDGTGTKAPFGVGKTQCGREKGLCLLFSAASGRGQRSSQPRDGSGVYGGGGGGRPSRRRFSCL